MSKLKFQPEKMLDEALPIRGLSVASAGPAIDLVHLARQSLGDKDRETEILALFGQQAGQAIERLNGLGPCEGVVATDLARMLAASARIAGAFRVASACEAYEAVALSSSTGEAGRPALEHLSMEIAHVRDVIGELIAC